MRAARSDWPLLRRAAATTMGRIGPRAEIATPTLVDLILFDEAEEVREAAADALGQIGPQALPELQKLLADREPLVRQMAIRGLRASPHVEQSTRALRFSFRDESPLVRVTAAAAVLSKVAGDQASLDLLVNKLSSEDRDVRIAAYRALREQSPHLREFRSKLTAIEQNRALPEQSRAAARRLLELIP
jgi:HEAT repeat protein